MTGQRHSLLDSPVLPTNRECRRIGTPIDTGSYERKTQHKTCMNVFFRNNSVSIYLWNEEQQPRRNGEVTCISSRYLGYGSSQGHPGLSILRRRGETKYFHGEDSGKSMYDAADGGIKLYWNWRWKHFARILNSFSML